MEATASAILRGANLNAFADTIATLVAQSPWERSAGIPQW